MELTPLSSKLGIGLSVVIVSFCYFKLPILPYSLFLIKKGIINEKEKKSMRFR